MTCTASTTVAALMWLAGMMALGGETTTRIVQRDGVTYRETTTHPQQVVPTTRLVMREQKTCEQRVTRSTQTEQHQRFVPVTEYRWVVRRQGEFNPFVKAHLKHELVPITHWVARVESIEVPVEKSEWVEGTRTIAQPVTTYQTVERQQVERVVLGFTPEQLGQRTAVASAAGASIGGQRIGSDPPRVGWSAPAGYR